MRRWAALGALILAGCGVDLTGTTAEVEVVVLPGDGSERVATLVCNEGPRGTSWLEDDPRAACDVLSANADRLANGLPDDRICTEEYAGPHTAAIAGTVNGAFIRASFGRQDGCAISDWDAFEPILGPLDPWTPQPAT